MTAYILRRLLQSIVVVFGVTIIVFVILHLLPGGPARAMLGPAATLQQIHTFEVQNGYTHSLLVQYVSWISQMLHGNLGFSYHFNQTVASLLAAALPKTFLLLGLAYLVALIVGVPLGILQAVRRNKPIDYALTGFAFVGYSMPVFWLGILLIIVLSVNFHIFPPEAPQGATIGAVVSSPRALVLPVITLAIINIAVFSRFVRSSALDNLVQDYIRTARAKGASTRGVIVRHLLRNSLIPVITLLGLSLPATISGAVITETIFNYQGMGLLFWTAATAHDFPVLLGFTVVVAVGTVIGTLLADVLYAVADPRIRYS